MKKFKQLLSRLIVPTVTVILISQSFYMTREITWDMIFSTINDIYWWQALLLMVLGFVAVLPTVLNDVILAKWQHYHLKRRELLARSWLINVFNINAGFVGTVGMLLRRIWFFDQKNTNHMKPYIQMYILSLTGLFVASAGAIVAVWFNFVPGYEDNMIWLMLLLGAAIFVGLMSFVPRFHFWQGMTRRALVLLSGNALLTYALQMALFVTIGLTIGVNVRVAIMLLLFTIANTIALVTMTPGTWGSFDVSMLLLFSGLAIDVEKAVVWLILYRLVYNMMPLASALVLFFYRLSRKINTDYRGVPHYVALSVTHQLTTVALYLAGILLVLSGTMPSIMQRITVLHRLRPWPITFALANQLPNILLGFLLLISARGIANRVKRAYWSTIVVLILVVIYTLISFRQILPVVIFGLLLVAVILSKKTLYREQFIHSWEQQVVDGGIWGLLIISYLALGVLNAPLVKHHFQRLNQLGLLPSVHWWLMGTAIILVVTAFSLLLSRYLSAHQQQLGVPLDEPRLNQLLVLGDTHYTNLAFLGDKRFYFYQVAGQDVVGMQFRVINNQAMVMGDPFGDKKYFAAGMQQFVDDADVLGYTPVFYEVSEQVAMLAHEFGYDFFKLGEEAHVILSAFSTAGKKMQNVRSVVNQAQRAGFEYQVLTPPFNQQIMAQLQAISQEWLAGREEKGYSLGFFDPNYLQRYPIAVLAQAGKIEAFATLVTSHSEQQLAVDLMRFTQVAPNGVMDVLFVNTIAYAKAQGLQTLNLGMSPLANVGQHRQSFGRERLANLVYQFGSKVYSFEGLHHYKSKFTKNWVPMYIAYSRKSWVLMVMIGLLKIDNKGVARAPEMKVVYDKDNDFEQ
ncbi:bifunctional lysylphosphatidylglycerol flippase/synthetase MprF [Leuconostoc holzapfelii]|uniref:Bifunctional lysylphosphatidylglycerol flippase/synthetase MprF n=1 Tax=Leuconostoc holzapfelii TaxID=434464 RepID=A0ABT2NTI1_9LACO|nr:bifunctional lysylphosphatidylglycerol flippase/synthetase MprF [Leuconostoc holzapfelii]MCT8388678.1 bifunctional lysylphosphatidylglycerol flippase/synthetase MprF [Leuconostoc holzapfelii]